MTMEIYGKPDEKKKPRIKRANSNFGKNTIAFITSLLTLFAIGIITKLVILNNHFTALQEQGFIQEYSSASILIYLASLFVLNIFIYELNVKLDNHPALIGITLATIFSLPGIISSITYVLPLQITIVTIVSNYISIILASYIFEMMWE